MSRVLPALVALLVCGSWCLPVAADEAAEEEAAGEDWPLLLDISAEYYLPTHADRHIDSVFLNALVGTELVEVIGLGGTLAYEIAHGARVELGARWMHVSNGQGLGPFNPSYEAACILLGVQLQL
jgi:hypothetical protein